MRFDRRRGTRFLFPIIYLCFVLVYFFILYFRCQIPLYEQKKQSEAPKRYFYRGQQKWRKFFFFVKDIFYVIIA